MDYGAIVIGIGIAGVIFAGLAWSLSGRALKYRMLAELMRDYAHPEMGKAVETLWVYYRKNKKDSEKVANEFAKSLKELEKQTDDKNQKLKNKQTEMLKINRRQVSHFYHNMAALHYGRVVPDKLLYRIWHEKTLKIIPEIIIPLGKALIKSCDENPDGEEYVKEFELLDALHKDSTKPGMTIF